MTQSDAWQRIHRLGEPPRPHAYHHDNRGFAGDCCFQALRHFVEGLRSGASFETAGRDYLRTMAVQEAVYRSAATGQSAAVSQV